MDSTVTRRGFVRAVGIGAGAVTGMAAVEALGAQTPADPLKIIAISGSPRSGKTTAQALTLALEAAKAVQPDQIETQLIELAYVPHRRHGLEQWSG